MDSESGWKRCSTHQFASMSAKRKPVKRVSLKTKYNFPAWNACHRLWHQLVPSDLRQTAVLSRRGLYDWFIPLSIMPSKGALNTKERVNGRQCCWYELIWVGNRDNGEGILGTSDSWMGVTERREVYLIALSVRVWMNASVLDQQSMSDTNSRKLSISSSWYPSLQAEKYRGTAS